MSFEPSSFDCPNPACGVDFSDYPNTHQDASISISAVVSASCVIMNEHPQHHDVGNTSQFHFPPESSVDTPFNGLANEDRFQAEDSLYPPQRQQTFTSADCNENGFLNTVAQAPFSNSLHPPYFDNHRETGSEHMEVRGDSFQGQTPQDYYETTNTSITQLDSVFFDRNNINYEINPFESSAVFTQCSAPISSGENFFPEGFPESSQSGDFESSSRDQSDPIKKVSSALTPCLDICVDEMIGSGVTVAGFKPRGIIRKRKKSKTPSDAKSDCYWSKRVKNNDSARRSRETKKEKERNFYKRALELEYENFYLKEKISQLESQLSVYTSRGSLSPTFI